MDDELAGIEGDMVRSGDLFSKSGYLFSVHVILFAVRLNLFSKVTDLFSVTPVLFSKVANLLSILSKQKPTPPHRTCPLNPRFKNSFNNPAISLGVLFIPLSNQFFII